MDWKEYSITVSHQGQTLQGLIRYCSKDFTVHLQEPFFAANPGSHLMAMMPARFTTPLDTQTRPNLKDIDLVPKCQDILIQLFEKYKTISYEEYVPSFVSRFQAELEHIVRPVLSFDFPAQKKELKRQLKDGIIDNKDHSVRVKDLRKQSHEILFQAKQELRAFVEKSDFSFDSHNFDELHKHLGL